MANNFESNFTRKVMMKVAEKVESNRVMSKNVDTQRFSGAFNPNSGQSVDIKRPTDYTTIKTANGDVTGQGSDIITGKATATVQDYLTVKVDYNEAAEALEMGTDMDRFWDDIATRIVTDHETDFAAFMMANSGLSVGTPGEGVDSWKEVAEAGALMQSVGVPNTASWYYALNPYSQVALANEQRSLGTNPEVGSANSKATVMENFAGLTVKSATTLSSYMTGVGADRAGVLAAAPDQTYLSVKDTMKQAISVSGLQANLVIKAGEEITIAGINRLNQATRMVMVDATGTPVPFTAVVTEDVTLDGAGAGTLVISAPAIYEVGGAYNTVDDALAGGEVVTLGGGASTIIQPNLFWHRDAFSIAYVDIKKLHSTDTIYKGKDGITMRCSLYSNGDANQQTVRFDLRPAFGAISPHMAGRGFGKA